MNGKRGLEGDENANPQNTNLQIQSLNVEGNNCGKLPKHSLLHDEYFTTPQPIIISLDGNIGAGKSTLLEELRVRCPDYECVVEPVGEWMKLVDGDGKSLLENFYEDKKRWAYSFQNCAILTRIKALREAIRDAKKRIIITERSVLTDRHVFAEMLRDSGDLNLLEWTMYTRWFDEFACDLPLRGIIYITTGVDTSAERIQKRARTGESGIPKDYLTALETQHEKWVSSTNLPVCRISTDTSVPVENNVKAVVDFIQTNFLSGAVTATPFHSASAATNPLTRTAPDGDEDNLKRLYPAVTPAASSSGLEALQPMTAI